MTLLTIAQAAAVQIVATSAPAGSDLPPSSPDDIRVPHIPQPVKDAINEERGAVAVMKNGTEIPINVVDSHGNIFTRNGRLKGIPLHREMTEGKH